MLNISLAEKSYKEIVAVTDTRHNSVMELTNEVDKLVEIPGSL